uniref:Integrase core domain containing protein n=1 Tax=Solanum tuberosum TaxID=4113 RepID=M1DGV6_SOLTU
MAHMRTQINLLTKHIVTKSEKVNVVGQQNRYEDQDVDLDETLSLTESEEEWVTTKKIFRIITLEIRVTILEMLVGTMLGMLIETNVLAVKNEIKDEVRTELAVLKDRLDGLENLVQDRFQAAGSVDIEEFKSQLAEMRTQIAKLAVKPVHVPTPIMPESLMQMLTQAPSTQSIDDLWEELPTSKSGKRKHTAREIDEETPTDLAREARR